VLFRSSVFFLGIVDCAFLKLDLSVAQEGLVFPFTISISLIAADLSTYLATAQ
jgi:hypothetical protein